jgi:Zn-dependent M28 family amino/carboxypeptidase
VASKLSLFLAELKRRRVTPVAVAYALVVLTATSAISQERSDPLLTITEAELRDHVFYLASDFLEGRDAPSDGYRLAAQYAAVHLGQAGLRTMYTDSAGAPSFFQEINFVSLAISPESGLHFTAAGVELPLVMGEDFVIGEFTASGMDRSVAESPIFLGFGIEEPELGWNDYDGLDVSGRIGIMVTRAPMREGQPVLPEPEHQQYSGFASSANVRIQAAINHGITTLILVLDSASAAMWEPIRNQATTPSTRPRVEGSDPSGPAPALSEEIFFKPESAVDLLSGTGLDPTTGFGSYTPGPMEDVQVSLETRHAVEPGYSSPNVVGLLPGSDPALKDEYIVVTAHLDHVRVQNGEVFNGADDNASGSAAVLEAAEAAARTSVRRSIIFVLTTAEEEGMLGSTHFVDNPPVPIESIVLNINVDMVGRNSPEFPDVLLAMASENGRAELLSLIREVNESGVGAPLDWRFNEGPDPHDHVYRSDQRSFMQKGVPAILLTRGFMGPHFHEATDDPETINYEKVLQAARLTFGLAVDAANRDNLGLGPNG